MKRRIVFAAAAAAALVTGCSGSSQNGGGVARVGRAAPSWSEPTSAGGKLSMASLRGKAVYLNFFATWCPPCNQEAPEINALQKQYASSGFQTVGIDELESASKAAQFVRKYGLVYPAVVDDGTLQAQYNVNGLPVHVFIDRGGVVRQIVVGQMTQAAIRAAIQKIL